jgi:hypothetical protein
MGDGITATPIYFAHAGTGFFSGTVRLSTLYIQNIRNIRNVFKDISDIKIVSGHNTTMN